MAEDMSASDELRPEKAMILCKVTDSCNDTDRQRDMDLLLFGF
jgi:hypothetical protein